MKKTRTIQVKALTRVEGEGGLDISVRNGRVEDVRLRIYEPPRFFEAMLKGRPLDDVPDITARICGICPVAYQMSAVHALERAMGVGISDEVRLLRRLLYCGEWIESHALHIHLLHAPDFFRVASGLELAKSFPEQVTRGLRLKKHGNQLLEVLGGRAIHPINVCVGGFYREPSRQQLKNMIPDFEWGLQAAVEMTRWVASFEFPDFACEGDLVSLRHDNEYPMNEGDVVSSSGLKISVEEYDREFAELQVPHSTALHSCRTVTDAPYLVGPLSRVSLNRDLLSDTARRLADEVGLETPCRNPFMAIIARGLEVIHAYEEALSILKQNPKCRPSRTPWQPRDGVGCAATEAPRGLIYHRYEVSADGKVRTAKIVPPTSQNQAQIEQDLRHWVPGVLSEDDQSVAAACERLIRCYDPCISCSTHFLNLRLKRLT